jgi:esterase/lipase superfamily enzyme/nucleoid DNA-binding protein
MTKRDLIAEVAKRTGLSLGKAAQIVEIILKAIADAMGRGEQVAIAGFGAFVVRRRGASLGRNPRTGERIRISTRSRPAFRPYGALKAELVGTGAPRRGRPALDVGLGRAARRREKIIPKPPETSVRLTVFYGTNRTRKPGSGPILDFGPTMADRLTYGRATVSVPTDKAIGALPQPAWWRPWEREDPRKHVILMTVTALSRGRFQAAFARQLAATPGDALVFIHGFNVTFADAARRTAQIARDLRFPGVPAFFSWPSAGRIAQYFVAGNNIERTLPTLVEFLRYLHHEIGAKRIHILAHSMGSRALMAAFERLAADLGGGERWFTELILAAPDIDADVFAQLTHFARRFSGRLTMYASSQDRALIASRRVQGNRRAGDTSLGVTIVDGVDTIDASKVRTDWLGHSNYAGARDLIVDLYNLIVNGHPPARRHLDKRDYNGKPYWVLP